LGIGRSLIQRIVDSVANGQKYHLKVVFSDNSSYHSTRLGDLAVLSGRRRRNLRGYARDHQLLPHHFREGTFRSQRPVHTHRPPTVIR
jgi:hypothetical protein